MTAEILSGTKWLAAAPPASTIRGSEGKPSVWSVFSRHGGKSYFVVRDGVELTAQDLLVQLMRLEAGRAPHGDKLSSDDDLLWLRSQIFGLCEDTEDKCAVLMEKPEDGEVAYHFNRGRVHEAKGIRRAIADVVRCRLMDRADAPQSPSPDTAGREGGPA